MVQNNWRYITHSGSHPYPYPSGGSPVLVKPPHSNSPKSAPAPTTSTNTGSGSSTPRSGGGVGPQGKKPGDGKKCRKIFGVQNKVEWCNACKWKKACVKFTD